MNTTSEIEANIRKISLQEATTAWNELHEEALENLLCLLRNTLEPDIGGRLKLPYRKLRDTENPLAFVHFTGKERNRRDIPESYTHWDILIDRVEFHPALLKEVVREKWISKESDRLATQKIKHLLSSIGVIW
jgi:hypothetical protein